MEIVAINAETRDTKIKASVLRSEGKIPAVLYGGNEIIHFNTNWNDVRDVIYTPNFRLAELDIDGKQYRAIVKDVQFHPVTEEIEHIDFFEINNGKKVNVEIPVRFKGTSPGVKNGGRLVQSVRKVKVKVDPVNLVDELFIDISELKLGEAVRVRDINFGEGMTVMVNQSIPVAVVETPRALKSAAAKAEAGAEADAGAGDDKEEGGEEKAAEE